MAGGGAAGWGPGMPGATPRPSGMLGTVLALRCCAAGCWEVAGMPGADVPRGPLTPSCLFSHTRSDQQIS